MSAIDFPTPSGVGATFAAGNGVVYTWTGTLWLASGASAGGDFSARHSASYGPISGTLSTVLLNTVTTGNSGSWYNTANGRWTPPAGRYFVSFVCSFTNNGALSTRLAKNGVALVDGVGSTYTNLPWANVAIDCTVDMNGTDYVEAQAGGAGLVLGSPATVLTAYPISGIKGPPGDPYSMTQVGGDFMAMNAAAWTPVVGVVPFANVTTGNSGSWFSTSTNRFTPPAGRYYIFTSITGYNTGTGSLNIELRKNGAVLSHNNVTPSAASQIAVPVFGEYDANGTDYFDVFAQAVGVGTWSGSANANVFGAYPISGIKGPPGDYPSGAMYMYSEQVLASPAAQIVVTIPANCKRIDLQWGAHNVGDANGTVLIQHMETGVPQGTTNYQTFQLYNSGPTTPAASSTTTQAGYLGFGVAWSSGTAQLIPMPPSLLPNMSGTVNAWGQTTAAGNRYILVDSVMGPSPSLCTGFRLVNSGSSPSFDTGSFLRAYVAV